MSQDELLTAIMAKINKGMDAVVTYSDETLPTLVNQFLAWEFVYSVLWGLIGFAILMLAIMLPFAMSKSYKNKGSLAWSDSCTSLIYETRVLCYVVLWVVSIPLFLNGLTSSIKVLVSPDLYLIQAMMKK